MVLGKSVVLGVVMTILTSGLAAASVGSVVAHDHSYNQALRYEASVDKTITPAKVMRWLLQMRGRNPGLPSPTEFQPSVNVKNSNVRIIAAIAYKF